MSEMLRPTLSGKVLRWVLCLELRRARGPLTVAEVVARLEPSYTLPGRPGKLISDALRWEVRRGRVVSKGRGSYAIGRLQRSTEWSMRRRVEAWRDEAFVAAQPSEPARVLRRWNAEEIAQLLNGEVAAEPREEFRAFDADLYDPLD